ncbi:polysaccharide biosynthesis/export family protein [Candidatus Kuenenia sp.]|uniref:polysaccharide biosynthesis/export family protein n=1 Tax=Candidatus Kuenenia sp. TaxID=2499824 RepID=UPI00321FDDBF
MRKKKSKTTLQIICIFIGLLCTTSFAFSADNISNNEYVVGPEDILDIRVWDNEDMDRMVEVSQNGAFTFPLIGKVDAEGLSVFALEILMEKKFLEGGYLVSPQVTIKVEKYQSKKVYVVGEVITPGEYDWKNSMTVRQAIAQAGGVTEKASPRRVIVVRTKDGKEKEYKAKLDALVKPKDIIRVPVRYF